MGVELGHEMGEVGGGVDVLVGGGEEGGGGLGGEVHDGEQKGGVVALDLFLDLFELLEALLGFGSEEELLSVFDAVLSDIFTLIWGVNRGDVAENPFQFVLLNPLVLQHQLVQPPICLFHNLTRSFPAPLAMQIHHQLQLIRVLVLRDNRPSNQQHLLDLPLNPFVTRSRHEYRLNHFLHILLNLRLHHQVYLIEIFLVQLPWVSISFLCFEIVDRVLPHEFLDCEVVAILDLAFDELPVDDIVNEHILEGAVEVPLEMAHTGEKVIGVLDVPDSFIVCDELVVCDYSP